MGSIKDRNDRDLTEAEDTKKGWQEYTEELYKKDLHDPDNHDGVITHLEPDILECEIKWALGMGFRKHHPLEKEMATHSSILVWRTPWTEEPGRVQFIGSQKVGHN